MNNSIIKIVPYLCIVAGGIVLCVGCKEIEALPSPLHTEKPVEIQNDKPSKTGPKANIRVCTYNIQNFTDGIDDGVYRTPSVTDWQARNAAKILKNIGADIVFIEEIENRHILKRLNDYMDSPYPIVFITQFDSKRRNGKLNIAILSHWPIDEVHELDFKHVNDPARPPRGAISAQINLGQDHHLLLYGVHLKSNYGNRKTNIRKRQAGLRIIHKDAMDIMSSADSSRTWEVMIIGDMNVDPDAEAFKEDLSLDPVKDWKDLWRGFPIEERASLPKRDGDPDIDYPAVAFDRAIVSSALTEKPWVAKRPYVVRQGVDINNVFVKPGQNEIHVSDHYPVYVDLVR
ncbi:MAG: hypothetical protein GKR87_03485 [Kiritimatiellae bacterium]|nr:hypothetical protein [Kiritimatiellia bacterium]